MNSTNPLDVPISQQRKAILSAVLAGLGSLTVALVDMPLTPVEVVVTISAAVAAYAGVFGVGNGNPPSR